MIYMVLCFKCIFYFWKQIQLAAAKKAADASVLLAPVRVVNKLLKSIPSPFGNTGPVSGISKFSKLIFKAYFWVWFDFWITFKCVLVNLYFNSSYYSWFPRKTPWSLRTRCWNTKSRIYCKVKNACESIIILLYLIVEAKINQYNLAHSQLEAENLCVIFWYLFCI